MGNLKWYLALALGIGAAILVGVAGVLFYEDGCRAVQATMAFHQEFPASDLRWSTVPSDSSYAVFSGLAAPGPENTQWRRAEYFFLIRTYLVLLAGVMVLAALIVGLWSRGKAIPLTRLRYEKLIVFGSLAPLVVGGLIMYFNLFGATAYGIWYNWPGFLVNLVLLSCAMLFITLAMTRKYVNRYCHTHQYSVPPFQRWPFFLNIGTLAILLVAALLPPEYRLWQFLALGWVVFTAILYLLRELRFLRELTRYRQYYRLAAGTAYLTLCISALFVLVIAVPLWWYLQRCESPAIPEIFAALTFPVQ